MSSRVEKGEVKSEKVGLRIENSEMGVGIAAKPEMKGVNLHYFLLVFKGI